jgi:predicted nucleic acid-binding Zn ribbon protein
MKRDIARELFRSYRTKSRKTNNQEEDRSKKEDPEKLSNILSDLVTTRDWNKGIAEGTLFTKWREIVGNEIADHCEPITLFEGRLTIKAESTSWATQLRLITPDLLKNIRSRSEGALVEELTVIGPNAPSWKRGLRTIRGARGPRDTYG